MARVSFSPTPLLKPTHYNPLISKTKMHHPHSPSCASQSIMQKHCVDTVQVALLYLFLSPPSPVHFNQPTNFGLCFCIKKKAMGERNIFRLLSLNFVVKKFYTIVNCSFSMGASFNLTDENILKFRSLKLLFLCWGCVFCITY